MNLDASPSPDQLAALDGEGGFVGVNERLHATQVPPGFLVHGKNIRCTKGEVEPRLGIGILPFGLTDGVTAFPNAYDQGIVEWYDPTDQLKWLLIAANGKVYKTMANRVAEEVSLPAGITLTAATFKMFVPCKNQVVILRGPDEDPLICEDLTAGFTIADRSITNDGTDPMPRSSFGIFFANRLILIYDYDRIAVSDDGDVVRFTLALNAFQINEGDNDALVAIAALDAGNLIFLKERSVWRVTNIGGDIAQAIGPLLVTDQYGCHAPHSIVRVGSNLWWWTDAGMVGLRQTEQNEVLGQEIRLTDDLEVTLKRIHRGSQHKITSTYHDGKVYLAVPLDDAKVLGEELVPAGALYDDGFVSVPALQAASPYIHIITGLSVGTRYQYAMGGANDLGIIQSGSQYFGSIDFHATATAANLFGPTENAAVQASLQEVLHANVLNAVLVFDTRTQAWAGSDESAATRVLGFVRHSLWGQERLCFLSTDGWLRIYDEGYEDEVEQAQTPWIDLLPVHYTNLASITALIVNGGTTVAAAASSTNTSSTWGTEATLDEAADNLWADSADQGGYNQAATSPWTAPNTTPSQVAGGLRFTSTNGALPTISVNAVNITASGPAGPSDCLYADVHGTTEIQRANITSEWTTRAYQVADLDRNRFAGAVALLRTWAPKYTLTTVIDGVGNELAAHTDRTRDRTKYTAAMKADWSDDNTNDDHGAFGREDYSMLLPGTGLLLGDNGINFELHQDTTARVALARSSHWLQLNFSNTQGRCILRAVKLEAVTADRPAGVTSH